MTLSTSYLRFGEPGDGRWSLTLPAGEVLVLDGT
jgi:hypothetical protein